MAKGYISNRQKNLKIGIVSYTENETVLEVTGNIGIKTTNTQDYELYVSGDANISGIVSASAYYGSRGNLEDIIANVNVSKIEGIELQEEGSGIGTSFNTINFVGSNITVTGSGSTATVTVSTLTNLNTNQDFGLITESPTGFEDFEYISNQPTSQFDFGTVITTNVSKIEGIELQEEGSGIGTSFNVINFVGSNVTVSGSGSTATVTISSNLNNNQDFGSISESPTALEDFLLIADQSSTQYDFGSIITTGIISPSQFIMPSFTVNTLPDASPAGQMLFVTDETGGSVPAFSDGINWRRITDRQVVS